MSIRYGTVGYNVGTIDISTKLVAGETVDIGTQDDCDTIESFANTGIIKIKATIDMGTADANFDGVVTVNKCPNGVEFATITYFSASPTGSTPIIVGGQIFMADGKLKCHVVATPVS